MSEDQKTLMSREAIDESTATTTMNLSSNEKVMVAEVETAVAMEIDGSAHQESVVIPPKAVSAAPVPVQNITPNNSLDVGSDDLLDFRVITNDGMHEHSVQLMTLKNIFSKQLPKMPKEYIVRLVFDRKHKSMVIVKKDTNVVVGGICYRPYYPQHFAEIAFCAITASEQVKGYGTRLMNHVKEYVKTQGIGYFLTYADNYAIGYFRKQGFSKTVEMPREQWYGYIKDYDGGTLMECVINMHVNYLNISGMLAKQRAYLLEKIKARSQTDVIHPGLTDEFFLEGRMTDIFSIPGIQESGWSAATIRHIRSSKKREEGIKTQLNQILKRVTTHRSAWPFHEPVDTSVVTDYLDVVTNPIDLTVIAKRVKSGEYYKTKLQLRAELQRMCTNCLLYNDPATNYYKAALDLEKFITEKISVESSSHATSRK